MIVWVSIVPRIVLWWHWLTWRKHRVGRVTLMMTSTQVVEMLANVTTNSPTQGLACSRPWDSGESANWENGCEKNLQGSFFPQTPRMYYFPVPFLLGPTLLSESLEQATQDYTHQVDHIIIIIQSL